MIISNIYFAAINITGAETDKYECGIQSLEDSSSDPLFVRQYEYPW